MLESGTFGSVRGVPGNGYPYRNPRPTADVALTNLASTLPPLNLPLQELQWRHRQVRGVVAPGGLRLEHHLPGGVGLDTHGGRSGAGAAAARLLQRL